MAGMTKLRYPLEDDGKTRMWARFRQVDFESDSEGNLRTVINKKNVVYMYLAGGLAVNDSSKFNTEADLGSVGAFLEQQIAKGNVNLATSALQNMEKSMERMWDGMKTIGEMMTNPSAGVNDVSRNVIAAAANKLPLGKGTGLVSGIRSGARQQLNPHSRVMFTGVEKRSMNFTFDMKPSSEHEAQEIERIIQFFRTNAYPEYYKFTNKDAEEAFGEETTRGSVIGSVDTAFYKYPSMISVDLFYQLADDTIARIDDSVKEQLQSQGETVSSVQLPDGSIAKSYSDPLMDGSGAVRIGPRFLYCYLSGVQTNYDSDVSQTMLLSGDGSRVYHTATSLSFTLSEDRTLHKGMIERGF